MRKARFQQNPQYVNHVQNLVKALLDHIFIAPEEDIQKRLSDLVERNANAGGSGPGFLHDGELVSPHKPASLRGLTILPIHESLEDAAEVFVKDREKLKQDRQRIELGFSVVSSKCRTSQDIRDALPDTLVALVPELNQIPRTRPEGFLFQNNTTLKAQFQTVLDLLFDYQFKHQMDALAGVSEGATP